MKPLVLCQRFCSYPMEWSALDPAEHEDVMDIKSHLMGLGFPAYVLNDIRAEDLATCEGALRVVVEITDEPVNDGRWVTTESGEDSNRVVSQDTVYDVKELRITGVGVLIPGEREQWIMWGDQTNTDVFATFSMPHNSEQQRGYVAYPIAEVQDGYIISSWFNYTHQRSWLQYPAVTAMEKNDKLLE